MGDRLLLVEHGGGTGPSGRTIVSRVQHVMTPEAARALGADGIKKGCCALGITCGRPVEHEEAEIQGLATKMLISEWPEWPPGLERGQAEEPEGGASK